MGFAYVQSYPGILKLVEEVLNIIAFSCVASFQLSTSRGDAFLAASIGAFVITFILLLIRVFDVDQKIVAPWPKIEFGYCLIWSVFYLITSALLIDIGNSTWYRIDKYIAGGSFGLFATCVYLVDAYDKFKNGGSPNP